MGAPELLDSITMKPIDLRKGVDLPFPKEESSYFKGYTRSTADSEGDPS
jgi:hypothetical protein